METFPVAARHFLVRLRRLQRVRQIRNRPSGRSSRLQLSLEVRKLRNDVPVGIGPQPDRGRADENFGLLRRGLRREMRPQKTRLVDPFFRRSASSESLPHGRHEEILGKKILVSHYL